MRLLETYDGYYYNIEQIVKLREYGDCLKVYMSDGESFYYHISIDDFMKMLESAQQSDDD